VLDGGFTLPAQWEAIDKGIKAKFGVTVDISSAESGGGQPALAQRLMQELKAGQKPSTEVFRGTITTFPELIEAGALEPVDWLALDPKIPPEAIEGPHGEALAVSSRIGGVAYNTKLVTGDDIPEKLSDLLKPKWKGLIASTPYPAGFDRAVFQTDPKVLVNFMFDLVEGGNFGGFLGCGAGDVTRVANGEFAMMALICSDSTVEQLKSQGAPIEIAFLKETSNASHTYFGVVKNAPHPNTAKLFLLYLVSPEGQKLMRKYTFSDMAFVEGNVEYQRVKDLKARGFNVPNVNLQTYADNQKLFKKWQRVFVRIRRGEIKRGDLQ
jgi:ABC-type Fe3+ transport system substrate-binding protein